MTGKKPLFQKKGFLAVFNIFKEDSFHATEILYKYFLTLLRGRGAESAFYTVKTKLEEKNIISFYESNLGKVIKLTKKGQQIRQIIGLLQQLLDTETYLLRADHKVHERKISHVLTILMKLLRGKDPFDELEQKYSEVLKHSKWR
ncbi:MAG: hypothetical protein R6U96_14690 [Promethearchaeia archaeon]